MEEHKLSTDNESMHVDNFHTQNTHLSIALILNILSLALDGFAKRLQSFESLEGLPEIPDVGGKSQSQKENWHGWQSKAEVCLPLSRTLVWTSYP